MRRTDLFSLLAVPVLAVTFACAGVSAQSLHEDNTWGFKIKVPRGWRTIPLKADEQWIIGKYQSDRTYYWSDENFQYEHKPEMKIMVFPESAKKKGGRVVEEDGETIRIKSRYHDYRHYLKENYHGGGWFFSKEEQGEIAGIKVEQLEIKVEKGSSGKKRIVAWVYRLAGADIAVDVEVLETRYRKLRSLVYGVLKSFRLAPRTEKPSEQKPGASKTTKAKKKPWDKMTPIERMKSRKEEADRILKLAIAKLPSGWKHKKSPHFDALTHVDARFTKKIINQAEAIRDWLDKNFYEVGEDYVPRVILRICEDSAEENAYLRGSNDAWSWESREIVVSKKTEFSRRGELEWLSGGICRQWIGDKNRLVYRYLPEWIRYGFRQYVGTALVKGKKLVFKPDDWERDQLRKGGREDKIVNNRDLMKMTEKDFEKASRKSGFTLSMQCGSLVRYLMDKKKTRSLLKDYMRHLNAVAKEVDKKREKTKVSKAKTEEEEEKEEKQRKERDEKLDRYIVDESFKRAFGHWTDSDWAAFERGWAKENL